MSTPPSTPITPCGSNCKNDGRCIGCPYEKQKPGTVLLGDTPTHLWRQDATLGDVVSLEGLKDQLDDMHDLLESIAEKLGVPLDAPS